MNDLIRQNFPLYFPIFFVLLWLAVTTLLSVTSGWFLLMRRYPDRPEHALCTFVRQSGSMNWVGMHSILNLSVCPSGLRVGITRVFGPFSRDFFVPWSSVGVTRKNRVLWKVAELSFGQPLIGQLSIPAEVANRLARAAGNLWPEAGPFPEETSSEAASRIAKQWMGMTLFAAAFFIIAPRVAFPNGAGPPIVVAVLFPAIVFGVAGLIQYARRPRS